MNTNQHQSFPIAAGTALTAFTRVKLDSSGEVVQAGAADEAIGTLEADCDGASGQLVADVYLKNGGSHYATASAAIAVNQRIVAAATGGVAPLLNGIVTDDDSATSNGTDVLISPLLDGVHAFLNSTNANNADAAWQIGNGGGFVNIDDNDSPAGVVLYFDEDATDPDKRFLCVSPTTGDLLVPVSDGSHIRVAHDASAASNGVAVHFDDNGANAYARMLFVSPTNTAGSFELDRKTDTVSEGIALEAIAATAIGRVLYS